MWLLLLMVGPYNAAVPKGPTFSFLNYVVVLPWRHDGQHISSYQRW